MYADSLQWIQDDQIVSFDDLLSFDELNDQKVNIQISVHAVKIWWLIIFCVRSRAISCLEWIRRASKSMSPSHLCTRWRRSQFWNLIYPYFHDLTTPWWFFSPPEFVAVNTLIIIQCEEEMPNWRCFLSSMLDWFVKIGRQDFFRRGWTDLSPHPRRP